MKTQKLYHYTGGTAYNIFDVIGGGHVIVCENEDGVSQFCCNTGEAENWVELMKEGQDGTVTFHEIPVTLTLATAS